MFALIFFSYKKEKLLYGCLKKGVKYTFFACVKDEGTYICINDA